MKTYNNYMDEISKKDLMEGLFLYGFFPEQLPPIFQSHEFYRNNTPDYKKNDSNYLGVYKKLPGKSISFETMRNINIPRVIHIPNPFHYYNQCLCLANHWDEIKDYFSTKKSTNLSYKISLNHLMKVNKTKRLLNNTNYNNKYIYNKDNFYKKKLFSNYKVHVDISRCFPSIYTHSIGWALAGKKKAKKNRCSTQYFNKIDNYTAYLNDGETHGILIGPHTSNLISEIILVEIDDNLVDKGWTYTRYIDDYRCYVSTTEEAQKFIIDLTNELRKFNLSINHRKTKIIELPDIKKDWVNELKNFTPIILRQSNKEYSKIKFNEIQAYLNKAKQIAIEEENNAVLKYAIKLGSNLEFSYNAEEYFIYQSLMLMCRHPYLIPLMEEFIFDQFQNYFEKNKDLIVKVVNYIYDKNLKEVNFEAVAYSLYYAIKYDVEIENLTFESIKNTKNPVLYILGYLYSLKFRNDNNKKNHYISLAHELSEIKNKKSKVDISSYSFQENWIFIYEVLNKSNLNNEWSMIKNQNVSFIKKYIWDLVR